MRKIIVSIITLILAVTSMTPAFGSGGEEGTPEFKNLAAGLDYAISQPADAAWPDSGKELTDGKFGSSEFWDGAWTGHLRLS